MSFVDLFLNIKAVYKCWVWMSKKRRLALFCTCLIIGIIFRYIILMVWNPIERETHKQGIFTLKTVVPIQEISVLPKLHKLDVALLQQQQRLHTRQQDAHPARVILEIQSSFARELQITEKNDTLTNQDEAESNEEKRIDAYISFFLCSFLCAAALQWLISHFTVYTIPISIIWFLFGMVLYLTVRQYSNDEPNGLIPLIAGILYIGKINAQVVYFVFLPILLYEACLNINWHKLKRFCYSGITLAVFGVAYQVAVVGFLIEVSFSLGHDTSKNPSPGNEVKNSWSNAFLVASSLASTDPVAVISVLTSLQAPEKLASMFEGESLINDGSSMLLFQFFKALSRGQVDTWQGVLGKFVLLLFIGPLWGIVIGILVYLWVKRFRRYSEMQTLILISGGYAVYYIGEKHLHTSGPLAIVCYGVFYTAFSHIGLDNEAQQQHYHSTKALASLANTSIFVIAGVVAMRMIIEAISAYDGLSGDVIWHIPILYIYLLIARATMIIIFLPILKRTGYGVNWKEVVLLVWGGLRGAIVLAMGLMIEQDHHILSLMRYESVLYIAGTTLLILLIHGVTFEFLFKQLNPYPPKPFRRVYLERVMKLIDYQYMVERQVLEDHWLFKDAGILEFGNKAVPVLGWRRMDKRGRIDFKLPSLSAAFSGLRAANPLMHPPQAETKTKEQHIRSSDFSITSISLGGNVIQGKLDSGLQPPSSRTSLSSPVTRLIEVAILEDNKGKVSPKTSDRDKNEIIIESIIGGGETAEQRAHAATASLLKLRDARGGGTTFDAKYYLRLVEHVTEPVSPNSEQPIQGDSSPTTPLFFKSSNSIAAVGTKPIQTIQMPINVEEREGNIHEIIKKNDIEANDGTELYRYDTDKTIIFGNSGTSETFLNTGHSMGSGTFKKELTKNFLKPFKSNSFNRIPETTRPVSDPLLLKTTQMLPVEEKKDEEEHFSTVEQSFTNIIQHQSSPQTISFNEEKNISSPIITYSLPDNEPVRYPLSEVINPSVQSQFNRLEAGTNSISKIASEPFGSSRLDSARMTRLRKPEWDSRRPSTASARNIFTDRKSEGHVLPGRKNDIQLSSSNKHQNDEFFVPVAQIDSGNINSQMNTLPYREGRNSILHHLYYPSLDKQQHRKKTVQLKPLNPTIYSHTGTSILSTEEKDHYKGLLYTSGMPSRVASAPLGYFDSGPLHIPNARRPTWDATSIGSSEEYLEIPETPRRLSSEPGYVRHPIALVKVLRKEREGELYIMAFNAIRQMYRRLYEQHFIGGTAMLSLTAVLDTSIDFAIGKLKRNPIKAWKEVLDEFKTEPQILDPDLESTKNDEMTGFEFEWRVLVCGLRYKRKRRALSNKLAARFPSYTGLYATITYSAAVSDLQQISAFVDVHEELLWKGGTSLEELLGPKLFVSFKNQIFNAKKFVDILQICYPDAFPYALAVHAATLLVNLKQQVVQEQEQKGLILEEDSASLNRLFHEQLQNLGSFRPGRYFSTSWLYCCKRCTIHKSQSKENKPPEKSNQEPDIISGETEEGTAAEDDEALGLQH